MPLTCTGLFLGPGPRFVPTEGNQTAENAGALVGQTLGAPGSALADPIVRITAQDVGGKATAPDPNSNAANDRVAANDGSGPVTWVCDAAVLMNATLTYVDGSTATVPAVVLRTTTGERFPAPSPAVVTPSSRPGTMRFWPRRCARSPPTAWRAIPVRGSRSTAPTSPSPPVLPAARWSRPAPACARSRRCGRVILSRPPTTGFGQSAGSAGSAPARDPPALAAPAPRCRRRRGACSGGRLARALLRRPLCAGRPLAA